MDLEQPASGAGRENPTCFKHKLSRAAGRAEAVPEEDAQNLMVKVGISITPGA